MPIVIHPLVASLRDAFAVAVLAASAWGLGRSFLRRIHGKVRIPAMPTLGIGLGLLSAILFLLGVVGLFTRPIVIALLFPGLIMACRERACLMGSGRPPCRRRTSLQAPIPVALTALALLVSFAGSLVPEWFFDALHYQTSIPELYLLRGRLDVFPHSAHANMPGATNLLFLPLLILGDAGTVKTFHWALLAGSCLLIWDMTRRRFGPAAGSGAAALFAATPGIGVTAGLGGVDLALVFFLLAGMSLLDRMRPDERQPALTAACGVLLGTALATKYTAVGIIGILFLYSLFHWRRSAGAKAALIRLAAIALGIAVVGGGWYLRNAFVLGDPVYPTLASAGSEESRVLANLRRGHPREAGAVLSTPFSFLTERRPFGAGGERLPVAPLLVAGVIWGVFRGGKSRRLALLVAFLFSYWALTAHVLRYLYPAIALAAMLAGGWLLHAGYPRRRRVLGMVLLVVACAAGIGRQAGIQHRLFGGPWRVLSGRENPESFLSRMLENYPLAQWVRAHTDSTETKLLLIGESTGYYYQRNFEPQSWVNPHPLARWLDEFPEPEDLSAFLRRRGFTHMVWHPAEIERQKARYDYLDLSSQQSASFHGLLRLSEPLAERRGIWLLEISDSP